MIVSELKGVGPKKAQALKKLSVNTVTDLLYLFPKDYQDRRRCTAIRNLVPGRAALTRGAVSAVKKSGYSRRRKQTLRVLIEDGSSAMEVVFFNAAYLAKNFTAGEEYYFYGIPKAAGDRMQMIHPEFSREMDKAGIIPIYPLTEGIGQNEMKKLQRQAAVYADSIEDYLPADMVRRNRLCPLNSALAWIHFPPGVKQLKQAKYRLIFDELFILETGIMMMKKRSENGISMSAPGAEKEFAEGLGFQMTAAQERVIGEIAADMESEQAMNRLVQGDVGSGKTAVAEAALYKAVRSGYQGVLMAPTDILMTQHYKGFQKDFRGTGIEIGYLSGHMSAAEKREQLEKLADGRTDIIIGTHALLQENVEFSNLGLVVTDEQHRFGVDQRMKLTKKGRNPDILVMTATPIPRTMSAVLYGDLDVSVIDEMPPGRKPVITKAVKYSSREKIYGFIEEEVSSGRQVYVVAPLITDSEAIKAESAESVYAELTARFPAAKTALLHGDMKQEEKDSIMESFRRGEIDIIAATVVIEVGINVPNATVMVIENSERFGLAQLHQLRGRVGRGSRQSYCILICGDNSSSIALERARIMTESSDGFYIAERDLDLRGPGEIFGTKQHGMPDMHIADLLKHLKILEVCRDRAAELLKDDPELKDHADLRERVMMAFGGDLKMTV